MQRDNETSDSSSRGAGLRVRLGIVAALGVLATAAAVTVVAHRAGHEPPASTARRVPVSVSCPAEGACVSVDDLGNAVHLTGTTWSAPTRLETGGGMSAVSCATPTVCVAVDIAGGYVRYDGHAWSAPRVIDTAAANQYDLLLGLSGITTVSCPTTTFCMAGDVLGRYLTFDGHRWTRTRHVESAALRDADRAAGTAAIVEISCAGVRFCAAVTASGRALTWEGTQWSSAQTLVPPATANLDRVLYLSSLAGVSCAGANRCVAVGPGGFAYVYDGSAWSAPQPVDPQAATAGSRQGLTAVSCATGRFCVAVDGLGRAIAYDGHAWAPPQVVDSSLGLADVSCASARFCVALDDLGDGAVFDGASWSALSAVGGA
jgi:hypothetical protein